MQRCGRLLPMFCGLCLCGHISEPYETAEPIEMPFGMWIWVDPGNHVGSDPFNGSGQFGGRAPLRCALSSKIFDHLFVITVGIPA